MGEVNELDVGVYQCVFTDLDRGELLFADLIRLDFGEKSLIYTVPDIMCLTLFLSQG